MSRFARNHRVFYFEEPVFEEGGPSLRVSTCPSTQVHVCTPVLPPELPAASVLRLQRELLDAVLIEKGITEFVSWYYTPMMREFSSHLKPLLTVYDCMDELSAFAGAPPSLLRNEGELFEAADLVFTGGASLFESKRRQHAAVHLYPSSVDVAHFAAARSHKRDPQDQSAIPHPRIGYAGVIDERMDLQLLAKVSALRPQWQFVMLGPVVKIDPGTLPKEPNIHYLGMKPYADLPAYFSGWSIGMLPFARNESTRFISPTKTPEYLAASLNVISTSIRDVVKPYGELGLAAIADTPQQFVEAAESFFKQPRSEADTARADAFLARNSWEKTWSNMNSDISQVLEKKRTASQSAEVPMLAQAASTKGAAHV
jgi:hypothetical protein